MRKCIYPYPKCETCNQPILTDRHGYRFHGSAARGALFWHNPKCPPAAKNEAERFVGIRIVTRPSPPRSHSLSLRKVGHERYAIIGDPIGDLLIRLYEKGEELPPALPPMRNRMRFTECLPGGRGWWKGREWFASPPTESLWEAIVARYEEWLEPLRSVTVGVSDAD